MQKHGKSYKILQFLILEIGVQKGFFYHEPHEKTWGGLASKTYSNGKMSIFDGQEHEWTRWTCRLMDEWTGAKKCHLL